MVQKPTLGIFMYLGYQICGSEHSGSLLGGRKEGGVDDLGLWIDVVRLTNPGIQCAHHGVHDHSIF